MYLNSFEQIGIIKLVTEINNIETKKKKQKSQRINETKNEFFDKINKIDKHVPKLTKSQKENIQINKNRKEKWDKKLETNWKI